MASIREILKTVGVEELNYISKEKTVFIVDRLFIEAWIEDKGSPEFVKYTLAFMDLLTRLKKEQIGLPLMIIPVDILEEMEKEGKKYVSDKEFIDSINTFFKVKAVDPKDFEKSFEAVAEMAKQFEKYKCESIIILTLDKGLYTPTKSIFPLTVKDMFSTILFVYGLFRERILFTHLAKVYDTWLSGLSPI